MIHFFIGYLQSQPFLFASLAARSVAVHVTEVLASLLDTGRQGLFALTDPDTGVVVLLVGLVGTFGVTDLGLEVVLLGEDKVADTGKVSPLGVSVDVPTRTLASCGDARAKAYILTTPLETAVLISSSVEPDPPWKTRKLSCVSTQAEMKFEKMSDQHDTPSPIIHTERRLPKWVCSGPRPAVYGRFSGWGSGL